MCLFYFILYMVYTIYIIYIIVFIETIPAVKELTGRLQRGIISIRTRIESNESIMIRCSDRTVAPQTIKPDRGESGQ